MHDVVIQASAGRLVQDRDAGDRIGGLFFSDQYDTGLEYVGYVPGVSTRVVLRGGPDQNAFMAVWLSEGQFLAGMHVNVWNSIEAVKTMIERGSTRDPRALADLLWPSGCAGQKHLCPQQ